MSSNAAIEIKGVSKTFPLFSSPLHRLVARVTGIGAKVPHYEAVKPLDLQIGRGEFFGIIGQNGSGKSTLLQMICGTLAPTTGSISVNGRVGALLELGAGFNPEFTGRENARLNASILGFTDAEFEKLLPEIMAFADIGDFFDKPVKIYSSGMYVRLAFAVQASIDPDILIIDEALVVGDIFFRLKCYERLERLRARGSTVILVTHSMEDVTHYCDRALLLDHGHAVFEGAVMDAVSRYYAIGGGSLSSTTASNGSSDVGLTELENEINWPNVPFVDLTGHSQVTDGNVRCLRIALTDSDGRTQRIFRRGETMRACVEFESLMDVETVVSGIVLRTEKGVIVHGKHSAQDDLPVPSCVPAGTVLRCISEIQLDVASGEYVVDVTVGGWTTQIYNARERLTMAELESTARRHCVVNAAASLAVIAPPGQGFVVQPFYGLAKLESRSHIFSVRKSELADTQLSILP